MSACARLQSQDAWKCAGSYPNLDGVGDKGACGESVGDLGGGGDEERLVGQVQQRADATACGARGCARDGGEGGVGLGCRRGVWPGQVLGMLAVGGGHGLWWVQQGLVQVKEREQREDEERKTKLFVDGGRISI